MIQLIKSIIRYREALIALVIKEISVRYKQSVLGPVWSILRPVIFILVFMAVRIFLAIPSDGIPYPIFVLAGLLPWNFFNSAISNAAPCLVYNRPIIRKIYFPREIFPLAATLAMGFEFAISCGLYICLMIYYGTYPGLSILFLPVPILLQLILGLAFGMIVSILGAFRRDIITLTPIMMMLWMYLSPVFYPLSSVPINYRTIYLMNPMAGIISIYREILLKNSMPDMIVVLYCLVICVFLFQCATILFRKLDGVLADIV